jgi:pilus assembly protein FimV
MLCLVEESEFSERVGMRAKPILTLTLLAAAMALPGTSAALGLGNLTVSSSLGQPLSARIELTSAAKEELDSLAARVADPSLYRQNNLNYPGALSAARVSVERDANGQPYLRIRTQTPINEPFLDLLVEINWASGRLVRDYTFLLDPPGSTMVAAPAEPVAPVRVGAAPARAAPAGAPAGGAGDTYTVKRGDTLSKIANEYRAPSATLDQMLVALFQSNADAFDGKNMNRLRSGAIITIPSADDVGATSSSEATKVVRVQASDWRAYRDRVAAAAPAAEGAGGRAAGGRIGTAVEEKAPAAPAGRDQLRVSREAGAGKGAGAAEEAVARDQALKEAQSRISELEKTIKDLQRAVELKSQTGAQLQAQADAAKGKAAPPPPTPITKAPEPVTVAKAPEPLKAPEPPKAAEPAKAEAPAVAEPAKAEPPKGVEPAPAEPPKVEPPKVEPPKVEPPKVEPPKVVPKAAPKVAAKEPPGFFEDLLATTPSWMIGAVALAILGGIAALVAARRRKTTKFEDSIISGTDIKTNTVFGSTGGGVVNTGDNSLASDFSREGLGNIDTDEVDPIAEAEVYLAYGRDAQAEEILKEALKKDPQRQEIYLKLLEIHAQHNKPSAFETVAAELYSVSQGQGEVWQKAVGLGRQLDPNNPMFTETGTGVAAAAAAVAAAGGMKAAAEEPPVLSEPQIRREPAKAEGSGIPADVAADMGDTGGGLDFKLDEEISISPSSGKAAKPKSPIDILAGAETALEKSAKGTAHVLEGAVDKTKAAAAQGAAALGRMGEGVVDTTRPAPVVHDMDFTLDATQKPAPTRPATPRPEPALAAAGASTAAPSLARPQAAIDLDKLDLSFDPDKATFEDPTPSVLDGQWHDAATKLDLAKAYQEMGDVEGAREILQEVLHEGDDQQKSEAQSLLAKLG